MVTKDDVISTRWSSHFWVKMHVFSTSFNNKIKACGWNDAKCLFMAYFTCQAQKKKTFISALTWFLISKIQDVGQDESIKTWEKHMCREARAETTVTNAWSWILIGSENEGRYVNRPIKPYFLPRILKPSYNFVANRRKYRYMTWIIYPLCLLISLSAWK